MNNLLLTTLMVILGNDELQKQFAAPVGKALADVLPDVTEDVLGEFLMRVGQSLIDQNVDTPAPPTE